MWLYNGDYYSICFKLHWITLNMERLLNFLKKFFKWTIFLAVALLGILFLIAKYNDHKYLIANSVDEEIGLLCNSDKSNKEFDEYYRFILQSSPNSREYSKYWKNIKLAVYEESKINKGKFQAWLINLGAITRTLDYVTVSDDNFIYKFNRQNYSLSVFKVYQENEILDDTAPCDVVDASEIREYIEAATKSADSLNIL